MIKTYLSAGLVAFIISTQTCLALIPLLKKAKAGQNILTYVKEHAKKSGTPTMGGLAFVFASTVCSVLFCGKMERNLLVALVIGNAYMLVGLIDDLLKRYHKANLGLRAYQKFLFQLIVSVFAGIYCLKQGITLLKIPFFGAEIDVGLWILPITSFVFVGTVNGVNLTDGLDGLAAGVSTVFFFFFGTILALQGQDNGLILLCFSLTGALCAYLLFNISRASVFMGDTGSLALGGFAACVGVFSGNILYVALLGIMFVVSIISVMVQVIYYKATKGKRVFLMSPIHHHFQQKGYSESKISFTYAAITAAIGVLCLLSFV